MIELESTTFFIDRCLGKKLIVETLRAAGVKVDRAGNVKAWKKDLDLMAEIDIFLK